MVEHWKQQIESNGIAYVHMKRKELMAAMKGTIQEMTATNLESDAVLASAKQAAADSAKAVNEHRYQDAECLTSECEQLQANGRSLQGKHDRLVEEFELYHASIEALDKATEGLCECCWKQKHEVNHG